MYYQIYWLHVLLSMPTIPIAVLIAMVVVTIIATTRGTKEKSEKMPRSSIMTDI